MKLKSQIVTATVALAALTSEGQGTFVFDQQSSMDEGIPAFGSGPTIQQLLAPYGQSFTPTLTSMGFIRLNLNDHNPGNGLGATLQVNIIRDSISGAVISSSTPQVLADSAAGPVTFTFPTPVALTPGILYYFRPIVLSGDAWGVEVSEFNYPGGMSFFGGQPLPGGDYWFREGVIVPEPSSVVLILVGIAWVGVNRRTLA